MTELTVENASAEREFRNAMWSTLQVRGGPLSVPPAVIRELGIYRRRFLPVDAMLAFNWRSVIENCELRITSGWPVTRQVPQRISSIGEEKAQAYEKAIYCQLTANRSGQHSFSNR